MSSELAMGNQEYLNGNRWGVMLVISIILHLSIFSAAIFLSGLIPSRNVDDVVYEVDLVDMPSSGTQTVAVEASKSETASKVSAPAKRINAVEEKKIPIPVEKITVKKKSAPVKKEEAPSNTIDTAIAKLQKKVKAEGGNHLDQAISDLEKKTKSEESHLGNALSQLQNKAGGSASKSAGSGTGAIGSLSMRIYQENVKSHIQDNWSYPAAMQNRKDLEVTVLLKVKEDGTILESEFIKKSSDSIFDQSVLKAIERSNPIPPFPEGYEKSYEEFKINFTLKELLEN
jgi:colicin import membrane protein